MKVQSLTVKNVLTVKKAPPLPRPNCRRAGGGSRPTNRFVGENYSVQVQYVMNIAFEDRF
jgi:hypothetical protein